LAFLRAAASFIDSQLEGLKGKMTSLLGCFSSVCMWRIHDRDCDDLSTSAMAGEAMMKPERKDYKKSFKTHTAFNLLFVALSVFALYVFCL